MTGNILFIVIDQFRADLLAGALSGAVDLPNIRSLMADGVTFDRHYTVTVPCGPSRASLLAGLYAMNHRSIRNGTPLQAHHPTLPLEMRKAGYEPLSFGYTDTSADPARHHPNDPALASYEGLMPGFAEIVRMRLETNTSWRGYLRARGYTLPDDYWEMFRPVAPGGGPDGKYAITDPALYAAKDSDTAFLTDRTLEDLSERTDKPWFAMVTYIRPHPPLVAPSPYNSLYNPASLPAPYAPHSAGEQNRLHPFFAANVSEPHDRYLYAGFNGSHGTLTARQIAELRAVYLGLASEVDAHIGRLLAFVDETGQADDTLVVLTADHGEMLGDHHMWGKRSMYDAALRIPLVIRDPKRRQMTGQTVNAFTETIDIAPTLLDWVGLAPPPGWNGASLLPFLQNDPPKDWRHSVFAEVDLGDPVSETRFQRAFGLSAAHCNFAVLQDADYKYVHFNGGLPPLLFSMAGDDAETVNLADDPTHQATLLRCARAMLNHRMTHAHHAVTGMALV